jgi:hypothetical protein
MVGILGDVVGDKAIDFTVLRLSAMLVEFVIFRSILIAMALKHARTVWDLWRMTYYLLRPPHMNMILSCLSAMPSYVRLPIVSKFWNSHSMLDEASLDKIKGTCHCEMSQLIEQLVRRGHGEQQNTGVARSIGRRVQE